MDSFKDLVWNCHSTPDNEVYIFTDPTKKGYDREYMFIVAKENSKYTRQEKRIQSTALNFKGLKKVGEIIDREDFIILNNFYKIGT